MRLLLLHAFLLGAVLTTQPAVAAKETDPLLIPIRKDADVSAKFLPDGSVRISVNTSRKARMRVIGGIALYKAATLAEAAGFDQIAVVKSKFLTMSVYGSPVGTNGYAIIRFVRPGDVALPLGNQPVEYVPTKAAIDSFRAVVADPDSFAARWGERR